jgi:hypothetical protein
MTSEGIEMRSVGNTLTLHETALIEAFNLRAATEYHLKNFGINKSLYVCVCIFMNTLTNEYNEQNE